jgi:succinate dehydrogenase/fumarate reductase cytochrome b subunit
VPGFTGQVKYRSKNLNFFKNSLNLGDRFYCRTKSLTMNNRNPYNWLRWIARITGILIVAFTLFFFIGEIIEGQQRHDGSALASYTPLILIIFVIWGIALAGLVLALWKEGLGGIISLISYMLVYILNLFNKEASMRGNAITIFLIFSIPSILYLVYWKLNKDELSL